MGFFFLSSFWLLSSDLAQCGFFDDGKEASKCFLSEFHAIKLSDWFLYFGPHPLPGPQHSVICSAEVGRNTHCSHYNGFIATCTHMEKKRPLCLSITKAILTIAQWRTRGSVYRLTERKRDPLGESLPLFCFGKEMDSWHFPTTIPCELFLSPLGVCSRIRRGPGF